MTTVSDFAVADHGSIVILTALTDDASGWVEDNLPDDAPRWAGGVVIERHCFARIIADNLTIT